MKMKKKHEFSIIFKWRSSVYSCFFVFVLFFFSWLVGLRHSLCGTTAWTVIFRYFCASNVHQIVIMHFIIISTYIHYIISISFAFPPINMNQMQYHNIGRKRMKMVNGVCIYAPLHCKPIQRTYYITLLYIYLMIVYVHCDCSLYTVVWWCGVLLSKRWLNPAAENNSPFARRMCNREVPFSSIESRTRENSTILHTRI